MSAWRIGRDATDTTSMTVILPASTVGGAPQDRTIQPATGTQTTADLVQKAADIYTKWIPGDVIVIYLALTSAFRATLTESSPDSVTPHAWGILVAGLALAGGLALLGAIAANLKEPDVNKQAKFPEIVGRLVLAIFAFGFWSLTVPGAWWEVKDWNQGVLAAIAFAISIVFALVAEIVVAILKR